MNKALRMRVEAEEMAERYRDAGIKINKNRLLSMTLRLMVLRIGIVRIVVYVCMKVVMMCVKSVV